MCHIIFVFSPGGSTSLDIYYCFPMLSLKLYFKKKMLQTGTELRLVQVVSEILRLTITFFMTFGGDNQIFG